MLTQIYVSTYGATTGAQWINTQKFLTMSICKKNNYPHGSGHEGGTVLLPGFATKWQQNQVTRQPHIRDLIHGYVVQLKWIG